MLEHVGISAAADQSHYHCPIQANCNEKIGSYSLPLCKVVGYIHCIQNMDNIDINACRNLSQIWILTRSVRTHTTALIEVKCINLLDDTFDASNTTHYGSQIFEENIKVWMLLKKSLLGHQPYHHIDELEHARDGCGAWNVLKVHHEGEDLINKMIQENLTKLCTLRYGGKHNSLDLSSLSKFKKGATNASEILATIMALGLMRQLNI